MAISLYDASVACFLQTLGAVDGFLSRGLAHCHERNIDPNEIVETRLFSDMLPFRYQILAVASHSIGAMRGVKQGLFSPATEMPPLDYAGLQKVITDAIEALQQLAPADVNALEGKDVLFQVRDLKLPFKAEGFLLSFSLPNFHFHATTAYDILRMKGVQIGKRDYMGKMRVVKS
jgi:uncharacterized protein